MDDNNNSLGKGLEALIPKKPTDPSTSSGNIPIDPNAELPAPHTIHEGGTEMPPAISDVGGQRSDVGSSPAVSPSPNLPAGRQASPSPAYADASAGRQGRGTSEDSSRTGPRGEKAHDNIFLIEVDKIVPNPQQPRRQFNEEALKELAASIREFGLLQPVVVTKVDKETPTGTDVEYQLIAGERRLLASRLLGLPRIPAIVRNVSLERERLELAVIENIQRENLNPIETARAFARLGDEFRMTQREIASRVGKSRETVANTMRLLDLPSDIQKAIEEGKISESHGRLLLTIDNPALQKKLFDDLITNQLTTRDLKNKVRTLTAKTAEPAPVAELSPELKMLQEKLTSELGAPVKISGDSPANGGKITITFYSEEELKNIVDRLGGGEGV